MLAPDSLAFVGVRGIFRRKGQPLGQRVAHPGKTRHIAPEPAVIGWQPAFAQQLFGPIAGFGKGVARAEAAPADAAGHIETGDDFLGGHQIFAAVKPGADEILKPDNDAGQEIALVEKLVAQVEAAVIEHPVDRAGGREIRDPRIAERTRQPRRDLKAEGPAALCAAATDRRRERGIGRDPRGRHVDQAGQAVEVVGWNALGGGGGCGKRRQARQRRGDASPQGGFQRIWHEIAPSQ